MVKGLTYRQVMVSRLSYSTLYSRERSVEGSKVDKNIYFHDNIIFTKVEYKVLKLTFMIMNEKRDITLVGVV